jgi:protein pelota
LSSMHESGRRLEDLTGIAAILTYPIEDLDEEVGGQENGADDDDEPNRRNDVHEDIDF